MVVLEPSIRTLSRKFQRKRDLSTGPEMVPAVVAQQIVIKPLCVDAKYNLANNIVDNNKLEAIITCGLSDCYCSHRFLCAD